MNTRVKWLVLLLFAGVLLAEDKKEQATQLFQTAIKLSDIRTPNSPPFRLEAHIAEKKDGKIIEGQYIEVWVSPRRWRREIVVGDYLFVQVSDSMDERHSWVFEPRIDPGIGHVVREFVQFGDLQGEHPDPKKVFQATKQGAHLTCVELKGDYDEKKVACFDDSTKLLQSVEHSSHGVTLRSEYLQYSPFGPVSFPWTLKSGTLEVVLTKLAPEVGPDSAIFSVPEHAERRPVCAKTVLPQPLSQREPNYEAYQSLGGGTVVLQGRIEVDGRVQDVAVVQSRGAALDAASLEAVRSWTFKPATCSGEPVPFPLNVEMAFTH